MDLNKVMLIGNLTRDPEIRTTPQGASVASFGIATNLVWTDASGQKQKKAEFHNIVAWRKLAEIMGQYLKKGSRIYLEGRLQTRDWTGQDGNKRQRTEIVADNMIMLDSKSGGASAEGKSFSPPSGTEELPTIVQDFPNASPNVASESDDEIKLEDIPF